MTEAGILRQYPTLTPRPFAPVWPTLPSWPEEIEIDSKPIQAATGREICPVDAVPSTRQDAEPEPFALVSTDSEVVVEVTAERGEPGHGTNHPLLERPNLGQRRARHQGERRVRRGLLDHCSSSAPATWRR